MPLKFPSLPVTASVAADFLTPERNLAKIGDYAFSLDSGILDEIQRRRVYGWAKHQPVGHSPFYRATGGIDDTIDLSGHFVLKKVDAFSAFLDAAAQKAPMPFVAGHGEVYGTVIVLEVGETRRALIDNGAHTRLDFTMRLAVIDD